MLPSSEGDVCPNAQAPELSVLTWNILADVYVRANSYEYCDPSALQWSNRKHRVIEHLIRLDADILCLQEVEDATFFIERLNALGYDAVYAMRPKQKRDGCLTVWRRSLLRQVGTQTLVDFNQIGTALSLSSHERNNIGTINVLEFASGPSRGQKVVVANTHLYWNPLQKDVALSNGLSGQAY